MKFKQLNCLILFPLILISILDLVRCQASIDECVLDIQSPSPLNSSNCRLHTWGGFINSCCGLNFDDYLYALALQANQTGKIFLSSSEQKACLSNFTGCGIEKLTIGAGACSDYTVNDVINKLGDNLRKIDDGCMSLSTENGTCGACLRRWEEITAASDSADTDVGTNLCGFAVLISLTSFRIYDRQSIEALYECLGTHNHPAGKQEASSGNAKLSPGPWILAFGSAGITVIVVLLAVWTFFRNRTRSHRKETDAHSSEFEDSTCPNFTIKEIYIATNKLSASNFIGEGIAGKVYKGILSNGQHVAVKHITNEGYLETFAREVRSLSHVRHPNLVALLGYCENEDECFLVYELCHKGNLSQWLFGKDNTLSWIQRLEIAVDSARGQAFLHNYSSGCIVHRDIKAITFARGERLEFADPRLKGSFQWKHLTLH
ncbi:hypothetical protein L6164_020613 [Bauhinia variegata]|uniref:Uncharacterized protein n=1 Tax=Bauhinia variegata TaxID=167791 RepID=A0ACB9MX30_BAUVA|nr:hypothetical protein L6164_020613 [Bauhinia variegata]